MNTEQNELDMIASAGGYGFSNFNPASIQEEEVIIFPIAMDISPSMGPHEKELNEAFSAFIEEMQKSHVAPKIMVKVSEFHEDVTVKIGFMPIANIDASTLKFRPSGRSTALADAALEAVKSAIEYRSNLEQTGIQCKVLVFVITDGEEMCSKASFADVKAELEKLMKDEKNVFTFETILFGIGDPSMFETAQKEMGFKHLAVVGQSGKEIRKMIGFISASVSSVSGGQPVQF